MGCRTKRSARSGDGAQYITCSCVFTSQKPQNQYPQTAEWNLKGEVDSACRCWCLMHCSERKKASDIPDTEWVGGSPTGVNRKDPRAYSEPHRPLKQLVQLSSQTLAHACHFLGLDENKAKKQK